jgi:hypothetical protein
MAVTEEQLAELVEIAQEQLRWQRAAVLPDVRKTIEQALNTTQLREAYELCDGETAANDIAKAVDTSPASLSGWTKRWRDIGIAYELEGKRTKHLATLKSLGLPVRLDDKPGKKK